MTLTDAVVARTDDLLKERKISRRQLARQAGLSHGTLSSIYKGLAKSVTLSTLQAICDGLGITMSEFLDCEYFTKKYLEREKTTTNV